MTTPLSSRPLDLRPAPGQEEAFAALFPAGATVDEIADGGTWFEGPTWTGPQEVVWSDVVGNRLLRWTPDLGVTIALEPSHHQNGHARDPEGRLIGASHGDRGVVRRSHDGHWELLTDRWDGKRFNSPNDLVATRDGAIWFTDPRYGIDKPEEGYGGIVEMDGARVYRRDPCGEVTAATGVMPAPNGLAFSPDERVLYVADSQVGHMLGFRADADGNLGAPQVVVPADDDGHPDDLRVDTAGRLWTSWGSALRVYAAPVLGTHATLLGALAFSETVANLDFGGPDGGMLAITATSRLYRVMTSARGATA